MKRTHTYGDHSPCGTLLAHSRHLRANQKPCGPCRLVKELFSSRTQWNASLGSDVRCGTPLGFWRHFSQKDLDPCDDCVKAYNFYRLSRGKTKLSEELLDEIRENVSLKPPPLLRDEEVFHRVNTSAVFDPKHSIRLWDEIRRRVHHDPDFVVGCSKDPVRWELQIGYSRNGRAPALELIEEARKLREVCLKCPVLELCYQDLAHDPHREGFQAGRVINPPIGSTVSSPPSVRRMV